MIWLVTGTRFGRPDVEYWLDLAAKTEGVPLSLVAGDDAGVDTQARNWAEARGVQPEQFFADWDTYGLAAGPRRNSAMVAYVQECSRLRRCAVRCFGFPKGLSKGTRDCLRKARAAGFPTVEYPEPAT